MTIVEVILLVLVVLAIGLHFLPKQSNPLIAKAQADVDDLYEVILSHFEKQAAPAPAPTVTQTVHAPAVPALAPAPVPAVPTVNGVPVPAGMTDAQFNDLVHAKQGVQVYLDPSADPSVMAAVANASDAWLTSLGPYYVQQLSVLTTAGTPVGDRVRRFIADTGFKVEPVTQAQDAVAGTAANQAAGK